MTSLTATTFPAATTFLAHLPERAVLAISGTDRIGFLNGLVSNDVATARPGCAVWAALLTAQGKWLADFFVFADGDRLLLDCEAGHAAMLGQRLSRYRLRADVAIAPTGLQVFAMWGDPPTWPAGGEPATTAPDPRLPQAGWRVLAPDRPVWTTTGTAQDWDRHRLRLGLPDGSRDLESEKTILLEAGFDELHGVSWTKGCYMGQELTARTRYRGLIKRRLLPVHSQEGLPPFGTPIFAGAREVGQMRSSRDELGLAVLRTDALDAGCLVADGSPMTAQVPGWIRLPQ